MFGFDGIEVGVDLGGRDQAARPGVRTRRQVKRAQRLPFHAADGRDGGRIDTGGEQRDRLSGAILIGDGVEKRAGELQPVAAWLLVCRDRAPAPVARMDEPIIAGYPAGVQDCSQREREDRTGFGREPGACG